MDEPTFEVELTGAQISSVVLAIDHILEHHRDDDAEWLSDLEDALVPLESTLTTVEVVNG